MSCCACLVDRTRRGGAGAPTRPHLVRTPAQSHLAPHTGNGPRGSPRPHSANVLSAARSSRWSTGPTASCTGGCKRPPSANTSTCTCSSELVSRTTNRFSCGGRAGCHLQTGGEQRAAQRRSDSNRLVRIAVGEQVDVLRLPTPRGSGPDQYSHKGAPPRRLGHAARPASAATPRRVPSWDGPSHRSCRRA
jgi:hypothetical protein